MRKALSGTEEIKVQSSGFKISKSLFNRVMRMEALCCHPREKQGLRDINNVTVSDFLVIILMFEFETFPKIT